MLNDEPILHIPPIAATGFPKTNSSVTYTINHLKVVCQLPTEDSEVQGQKDIGVPNVCPLSIPPTNSSTEKKRGRSRIKGVPFPKHAKDLLSTGIFDGIPVMYHHVSREDKPKRIQYAFIQGYGYLCGCCDCRHSKCMNAIEFQLHVGGKSCHPNSSIYFKSGKSVFEVVLELQKTAPERLSEAILSVTGCGLHEKNFAKWKASVLGRWRLGVKRQNGKQKGKKGKAKMNP
ncbi:hypothetical protein Nepgr_009774 [Nepenthes gracilis]|uniref:Tify domain-containing protein n=1 Tax=Nepenthes gracilis TaxID=150966 RepID=A0AAD3XKN4_NEPGR|nr:hypothetical protein Nepgr_009774 [Nepenthes gracilis]